MVQPKPGMQFTDQRRLDLAWEPGPGQRLVDAPRARMRITRVSADAVWYTYASDPPGTRGYFWDYRADFEGKYSAQLET